jgi:hypothetical protein
LTIIKRKGIWQNISNYFLKSKKNRW